MKKGWLFIVPWPIESMGGVNRVILELCKQCSQYGEEYAPFVLTPSGSHVIQKESSQCGYTPIHMNLRTPLYEPNLLRGIVSYFIWFIPECLVLLRMIQKYNINVVNFHYVGGGAFTFAALRCLPWVKFRLILSYHGSDVLYAEDKKGIPKKILEFIISKADYITACSKGLAQQVKKIFPSYTPKITFIHNGISELYLSGKNSFKKNSFLENVEKKKYLLTVGAFERKKGHDILLKAFSIVKIKKTELSLVIIGQKSTELDTCRRLIKSLDLEKSVFIFTSISPQNVVSFYDNACLFISASRYEPFGLVLIEAGARSVPVIATETMGAMEIIDNQVSGLIVPNEDPEALAKAILFLFDNPEIASAFSKKLKNKILSNFRWEQTWAKYENLSIS